MDDILLIDQVSEVIVIAETSLMREIGSVIHKMNKKKKGKVIERKFVLGVAHVGRCLTFTAVLDLSISGVPTG
jgi:hypothetical protein